MSCIHREKISKMVWEDEWDKLSDEYRYVIANDQLHLNELTKWFLAHCEAETNRLFNNSDFEFNDLFFFGPRRRMKKSKKS